MHAPGRGRRRLIGSFGVYRTPLNALWSAKACSGDRIALLVSLWQCWGTLWDTWVSIETSSGRLGTALGILRPPETPSQAEGSQVPRLRTKIEGGCQLGLLPGDLGQSRDIRHRAIVHVVGVWLPCCRVLLPETLHRNPLEKWQSHCSE